MWKNEKDLQEAFCVIGSSSFPNLKNLFDVDEGMLHLYDVFLLAEKLISPSV